jgi:hypothetical protein
MKSLSIAIGFGLLLTGAVGCSANGTLPVAQPAGVKVQMPATRHRIRPADCPSPDPGDDGGIMTGDGNC